MKKIIAGALCVVMATAMFAGCNKTDTASSKSSGEKVINLYTFTKEVVQMSEKFKELHPDFEQIHPMVFILRLLIRLSRQAVRMLLTSIVQRLHSYLSTHRVLLHSMHADTKISALMSQRRQRTQESLSMLSISVLDLQTVRSQVSVISLRAVQ